MIQTRKSAFTLMAVLSLLAAIFFKDAPSLDAAEKSLDRRIKVVATIFPIYDFARAVAADKADLFMLVRPGAEIHSFDPSPQDILSVMNADVFLYIGGENDVWVDALLKPSGLSGKTILRLLDSVDAVEEEAAEGMQLGEDEEEAYDEHIWTSPRNAAVLVQAVADALCQADPQNAAVYKSNADGYVSEIEKLGSEFKSLVAAARRKKIVVGDRFPFRYFVDEFGLEYRAAFPGCYTESDISAATMAYLVKTVKEEGIPVIYTLELSGGHIARAIAEQTGAEVLTLHSCHNVTKSDFEAGATYLSLMRRNVEALRKGLY
jgi:zinc transport system substrate-binding protein